VVSRNASALNTYFKLITDTLLNVFKKEVQCRNDSLSEREVHSNYLHIQVSMEGGNLEADPFTKGH
jgi:hypothetical protein